VRYMSILGSKAVLYVPFPISFVWTRVSVVIQSDRELPHFNSIEASSIMHRSTVQTWLFPPYLQGCITEVTCTESE
jgi:hypothetical protein